MFAPPPMPDARLTLELDGLDVLACGCVAGRFKALPWDGRLVRIEAKGSYCLFAQHAVGGVLGFGSRADLLAFEAADEPDVADLPTF